MSRTLERDRFVIELNGKFLSPDGILTDQPEQALAFVSIDNAACALRRWCDNINTEWRIKTIPKASLLKTY